MTDLHVDIMKLSPVIRDALHIELDNLKRDQCRADKC